MIIYSVEILGSDCPSCAKLLNLVTDILTELGIEVEVVNSSDIQRMISLGIISTPSLVLNNKVLFSGYVPDRSVLREAIEDVVNVK